MTQADKRPLPLGDGQLGDSIKHLVVLRETADFLLMPYLSAVDVHVENAATALDHLGLDAEFALDRLRQTGGRGVVVSLHAVFDTDVHQASVPSMTRLPRADACHGAAATRQAKFMVIKNSALVLHFWSRARSSSMASTTFMSDSTRRSR